MTTQHSEVAIANGQYLLLEDIGQGSESRIWRGSSAAGEEVVVKVIPLKRSDDENDRLRHYFEREIACGQILHHPAIRTFLSGGEEPRSDRLGLMRGFFYLVFEWIEFGSLRRLMDQDQALDPKSVRDLMKRVSDALVHAHGQTEPIVHRDIKPENILLPSGRIEQAKLADFGIASIGTAPTRHTSTPRGTHVYIAPEQTIQNALPDAASDQYSLALVAWEALVGSRPFDSGDANLNLRERQNASYEPCINVGNRRARHIEAVLKKALAPRPEDRYDSMAPFAAAFTDAGKIDHLWGQRRLIDAVRAAGIQMIDNRDFGGALWVVGGLDLEPFVDDAQEEFGTSFHFKPGGGRATSYRDAWWTADKS
jgi:eukaryotic-like serine/threonine-protein kinase